MGKRKRNAAPSSEKAPAPNAAEASAPKENPQSQGDSKSQPAAEGKEKPARKQRQDGFRETIESIVIAFVLAFLFRTFEAEAFVIPTGSMAETLMGRHKDVTCEKCHTHFRVSASDEVRDDGIIEVRADGEKPTIVNYGLCPNCRFPSNIHDNLAFVGDRILVNKFPYEFGDPERFDVVVFKYPEEPKTNYIKRLVGLPGETIKIAWGDLYARSAPTDEFKILRKPPEKQRHLQVPVYDDDKPARELLAAGWPERWAAVQEQGESWLAAENGWSPDAEARQFRFAAGEAADDWQWIRYRHILPFVEDWQNVIDGHPVKKSPPPQLITDFSSYNSGISKGDVESHLNSDTQLPTPTTESWGVHWVGDLTLSCEVDVHEARGELLLELVEGSRWYRCRIELATGIAHLEYVDTTFNKTPTAVIGTSPAKTPLGQPGTHEVIFTDFDDRLLLWVDGDLMDFGEGGGAVPTPSLADRKPTNRDLAPVGIAARDADVTISHLNLTRDIYYLSCAESSHGHGNGARMQVDFNPPSSLGELREFLSDPEIAQNGLRYSQGYQEMRSNTFELGEDEFFVLGDNSARSKDSRLWTDGRIRSPMRELEEEFEGAAPSALDDAGPQAVAHDHAVPRELLIGKAFFIYWPHGIPFMNDGRGFPVWYYKQPKIIEDSHGNRQLARGLNGEVPLVNSDQPSLTVPFYPQWWRWQRIR